MSALESTPVGTFDLLVIGGGVNGTGLARDAAMRGLKVMLVERRDWAAGSSGANSGMIHGGFRYMMSDPHVTELACIDSGYIQKIAPHLLFRIPFLYPFPWKRPDGSSTLADRLAQYATEVYFGAYDLFQPHKNGKPSTRLTRDEALQLEPGLDPRLHGALTMDEYGIDPFRLCALNARSARDHGAELRTYTEVVGFERGEGGRVVGARLRDLHTGRVDVAHARIVFNAGGPWATRIARLAGVHCPLRPGKGIHLTLDRRLSNYGIITNGVDGRQFFIMPHESSSIIGTTDDDYYGDPDDITITHDEVAYLLEGIARVFPRVRDARVLRAWAGVRNTAYAWGKQEDALSREHLVLDHADQGAAGFYTLVGGKLASYRAQAQEAADLVCRELGRSAPCRTHKEPLPGGEKTPAVDDLTAEYGVPAYSASRLVYRHGAESEQILELTHDRPELAAVVCPCEGTTAAELVWSIRNEDAGHLVDLRRRCRLGMGSCQGTRCIGPAAALLARERHLSGPQMHSEMLSLLSERWKGNTPVATGDGLAQAELTRGALLGSGSLPVVSVPNPARR